MEYLVIYLDDAEFETVDLFETEDEARHFARDLRDQGHTNIKIARLLPDD